ncbi:DNA-binding transcriptional MerR regulator [Roseibium hamelinense]|uniref:DNA-binding transcriptional MerR regulator n=1 Tax=Roseibium hamelinense TaxID=150831 RepID=A0A562TIB6_9HYPH|nr:MerR family transcriptional regulator [Roseibium hamelinense]MTI46182.1 MerR family transcriptional regulator [Roseibium hamelinense]TWI92626.1 DNA-binding transcriptional MerR regulator [Roseibium hamelinense]
MSSQDKSPDAFRTISEVADDLDLPQHVLRFWETRFSQIKPLKRGGGRRYYRPDDVELLRGIRHLLYGEGYTIKGVQRILKEQGPRFVMQVWKADGLPVQVLAGLNEKNAEPRKPVQVTAPPQAAETAPAAAEAPETDEPLPRGLLPDPPVDKTAPAKSGGFRLMERLRGQSDPETVTASDKALSKEDIRRLQSTLFELLECKRILDQVR